MRNYVIILALVTIVVFLSGCVGSETSNIDQLATKINENIKNGDVYYNQAATSVNKFLYDNALSQCNSAASQFDLAKSSSQEALIYARTTQDQIYIDYLQLTINEVDAKINATNELQLAIPLYQVNDTRSGNTHAALANTYMKRSLEYEAKKQALVNQNPDKFK
jgi:hypothetical protein